MKTKQKADRPIVADDLGDFTATPRVLPITLLAIAIGLLSSVVAFALLKMIGLFTNLFYFQRISAELVSPAGNRLGALAVLVPVVGALIIGLLARYGSERIRGHGIPEEAALLGDLDRLRRPFRRRGSHHHDGRRLRLDGRAALPLDERRAQDAARRGRGRGDVGEELERSLDGTHHKQRLFPIVDEQGDLRGVVTRGDLARWVSERGGADGARTLADIARAPVTAFADEPLRVVVYRMAETGFTRLPVVARDDPRKMVGHVALEDMLKARVRHLEEERRRERTLPLQFIVPRWLRSRGVVPPSSRAP